MKKIIALLLILIAAHAAFAQQKSNVTRFKITFEIKNLGLKTHGSLSGLQAHILFDPASLNTSKMVATADVNTLNTDNDSRDKHLKGEDYFDAGHYPTISMSSVSFKHKGGKSYSGQFNITIKNITKLIELPFIFDNTLANPLFKGSFKIKRSDFGIGGKSMILADEATVFAEAETLK